MSLLESKYIKAGLKYKRETSECGVTAKVFYTDNGVFTHKEFIELIFGQGLHIRLIGLGDSHHNEASRSSIKMLVYMAQTMLIHADILIPEGTMTPEL